jgi:DNA-binding transcriptional MerR regulator
VTTTTGDADKPMTVGRLARQAGVSPDTVRYYERSGLLPAPPRSVAGYRRYDATALDRLRFIQGGQRLGLSLREIRDLLAVRDTGACACEPAAPVLRQHLADLDAEMARLAALRAELVAMVEQIPGSDCPDPAPGTWCAPCDIEGGDRR